MSKKDYQAIARAIYRTRNGRPWEGAADEAGLRILNIVRLEIAEVLAASNPRFDRERFKEACETGTTKGMAK